MKKIIYSLVILIAASSLFTSCIQPYEENGIHALRVAKAKYIESLTGLKSAEASKANAEADYIKAQAAVEQAQVAVVAAQADYIKAETAYKQAEAKVKEAEAKLVEAQATALTTEAQAKAAALMAEAAKLQAEADSLKACGDANAAKIQAEAEAIAKEAEAALKVATAEAEAIAAEAAAKAEKLQAEAEAAIIAANSAAECNKIAAQALAQEKAAAAQAALIEAQAAAEKAAAITEQIKAQTDAEKKAAQLALEEAARKAKNAAELEAAQLKAQLEAAEAALIAAQTEKTNKEKALAQAKADLEQALQDIAANASDFSYAELQVVYRYQQAYKNLILAQDNLAEAQEAYDMAMYDNGASVNDQTAEIGLVKTANIEATYKNKIEVLNKVIALYEGKIQKFKDAMPTDFQKWDAEIKAMDDTINMLTLKVGQLQKEYDIYLAKEFTDGVNAIEAAQAQWFKDNADRWQELTPIDDEYALSFELPNNFWFSSNFACYAMWFAANTSVKFEDGKTSIEIKGTIDDLKAAVNGTETTMGLQEIVNTLNRENVVRDFQPADLTAMKAAQKEAAEMYYKDSAYLAAGFEKSLENDSLTVALKKIDDSLQWHKDTTAALNKIKNDKKAAWTKAQDDSTAAYKKLVDTVTVAEAAKLTEAANKLVEAIKDMKKGGFGISETDSLALINAINGYFTAKQQYIGGEKEDTLMVLRAVIEPTRPTETTQYVYDTISLSKLDISMFKQTYQQIGGYWYASSYLGDIFNEETNKYNPYPCFNFYGHLVPASLEFDAISRVLSTVLVKTAKATDKNEYYVLWNEIEDFNNVEKVENWGQLKKWIKEFFGLDVNKKSEAEKLLEEFLKSINDIQKPYQTSQNFSYIFDNAEIENVRWMHNGKVKFDVAAPVAQGAQLAAQKTKDVMTYMPLQKGFKYGFNNVAYGYATDYEWCKYVAKLNVNKDITDAYKNYTNDGGKKNLGKNELAVKAMGEYTTALDKYNKAKQASEDYINQSKIDKKSAYAHFINGYFEVYARFWGLDHDRFMNNADDNSYKNFLKDHQLDSLKCYYGENTFIKCGDGTEDIIAIYGCYNWDGKAFDFSKMFMLPNPKMTIVLQNMSLNVLNWDPNYCFFFKNDDWTEYSKMLAIDQWINFVEGFVADYQNNTAAFKAIEAAVAELPSQIIDIESKYADVIRHNQEVVDADQALLVEFFGEQAIIEDNMAEKMLKDGKKLADAAKYQISFADKKAEAYLDFSTRYWDLNEVGGYQLTLVDTYLNSFPANYFKVLDAIAVTEDYKAEAERIQDAIKDYYQLVYNVNAGNDPTSTSSVSYEDAKQALIDNAEKLLSDWAKIVVDHKKALDVYQKALDLFYMGYDPQQVVINAAKEALSIAQTQYNEANDWYTIAKAAYDKLIAGYTAE